MSLRGEAEWEERFRVQGGKKASDESWEEVGWSGGGRLANGVCACRVALTGFQKWERMLVWLVAVYWLGGEGGRERLVE